MEKRIIKKLVKAMAFKKNSKVLVHAFADETDLDEIYDIMEELLTEGIYPYLVLDSLKKCLLFAKSKTSLQDDYFKYMDDMDSILDIFYYLGPKCDRKLEQEEIASLNSYLQGFMRKAQNKEKFIQLRMPSIDQAQAVLKTKEELENLLLKAYDIDYEKLNNDCNELKNKLSLHNKYQLISIDNSILELNLGNRTWYIDAGDGDLPCGEIYIAPIEEMTNGEIYFSKLYLDGNQYHNIKISIEKGKIVKSTDSSFMEYISSLPSNGDVICELGIGLNTSVTNLVGIEYLDEKAINTIHLGIGMNTMFGGKNEAMSHLDLVGSFKLGEIK